MVSNINLTSNAPVSAPKPVEATTPTGHPGQDGAIKLDQIEIGKALQGQVVSLLSNGTSLVSLQNGTQTGTLQIRLPAGLQVGNPLQLTLLSLTDGKPNFSIKLPPSTTTSNPSQNGAIKLDQIEIGKAIQAQVISLLSNGNSLVNLQNGTQAGTLQMRLPPEFQVGNQLQLTLLSLTDGKPNFSINSPTSAETVNLSSTAQLLDKLIANSSNQQTKVSSSTPLLSSAKDLNPTHLASQLGDSIEKSGVFYESHLQQWSDGNRNIDQIRQEPQNQSANPAETANALIPTQLDTLENKRLTWQGEVYPGLPMQLEIHKDDKNNTPAEEHETETVWQTSLKIQLPNLGQVQINIRLQGEHAQLNVNTEDPATAASLKSASDTLTQALAASGTALDLITVHNNDKI